MLFINSIFFVYFADIIINKKEIENTQKLKFETKITKKENRVVERAKIVDIKKKYIKIEKQKLKQLLLSEIVLTVVIRGVAWNTSGG